jgi:outer membrane usher protein
MMNRAVFHLVYGWGLGLFCAFSYANVTLVPIENGIIFSKDLINLPGSKTDLLPIEVTLNGDKVVAQNVLRTPKGPAMSEADAKQARLLWTGELFTYSGDGWVLVSQLVGVAHTYDPAAARLSLKVAAQDLAIQKMESAKLVLPVPTAIPALITQYDWYSTNFSNPNDGQRSTTASAAVEHIFSLGAVRFNQSWGVSSGADGQSAKWTRVDSGLRYDDPASAKSWWLGDNFTTSQSWRRSYRIFGAGLQSNFAGRPDIQVMPRPTLNGFLVEPSTYELFMNNQKVGKGQFEPGRFEINNLPAVSANGDVRIVFQDALGGQRTQAMPFYVSPRQLATGLHYYQFNVGKLRTAFNGDAADYGDWVMAGEYGLGLTDWWTVRAASELAKDQANFGLRNVFSLWGVGSLTLDSAASSNKHVGSGYVSMQSDWRRFGWNLTLSADKRSKDFWRVGDSLTTSSAQRKSGYAASVGHNLGVLGSLGLVGAIANNFDGSRTKNISATYSKNISNRASLNLSSNFYSGDTKSKSLFLMINYNFDTVVPTRVLMTTESRDSSQNFGINLARDATEDFQVGFNVALVADSSKNSAGGFGATWTPELSTVNVNVSRSSSAGIGSQSQFLASGSGSITATSYGIFPSARVYDSAVLIDLADSPNVRANVGGGSVKTNAAGYAFVPQATGYAPNQAMFEPSDLPLEVGFSSQVAFVTPWPRSVAVVKFDIANTEGESFRVLDKYSKPIKVGSEVLLAEENQFIGRGGYLYLTSRAKDNEVRIKTPDESIVCIAKLPERKAGQARSEPITVVCD